MSGRPLSIEERWRWLEKYNDGDWVEVHVEEIRILCAAVRRAHWWARAWKRIAKEYSGTGVAERRMREQMDRLRSDLGLEPYEVPSARATRAALAAPSEEKP